MSLLEKARSALAQPLEFDGLAVQIVSELEISALTEMPGLLEYISEVLQDRQGASTAKILAFELLVRCSEVPIFLEAVAEVMIRDLYKVACHEFLLSKGESSFFENPQISKSFVKALSKRFMWMFATNLEAWATAVNSSSQNRLYRYFQRATRKGICTDVKDTRINHSLCRQLKDELSYLPFLAKRCYDAISNSRIDFEEIGRLLTALENYSKLVKSYAKLPELDAVCLHAYYVSVVDLTLTKETLEDFVENQRPLLNGRANKAKIKSSDDFNRVVGRRLVNVPIDFALLRPIVKTDVRTQLSFICTPEPSSKHQPLEDLPSPPLKRHLTVLNSPQFSVSIQEKIRIQVRSKQKSRISKYQNSLLSNESLQSNLEQDLSAVKEHVDMKMYEMNTLKKIIYSQDVHRTELMNSKKLLESAEAKLVALKLEFEETVSKIEEYKEKRKKASHIQDTPVQVKYVDAILPLREAIQDMQEAEGVEFSPQMSENYDMVEAEFTMSQAINEFKVNQHANYEAEIKATDSPPINVNWPNPASGNDSFEIPNEGVSRRRMNHSITVKSFMSQRNITPSSSAPVTPKRRDIQGEFDPLWPVYNVLADPQRFE